MKIIPYECLLVWIIIVCLHPFSLNVCGKYATCDDLTCTITDLTLTPNEPVEIVFSDNYHYNYNEKVVNELLFINCSLRTFPKSMFLKQHSLSKVSLSQSGITSLSLKDFEGASSLRKLNVSRNSIKQLEDFLFIYAPELRVIDLSFNNISVMPYKCFAENPLLEMVYLNDNVLKTFASTFFSALESLYLQNNLLSLVTLVDDHPMSEINLSNNVLLNLTFYPTAKILDLSNTSQTVCIFSASTTLMLDMSNNLINTILIEKYTDEAIIKELYLANNNLSSITNITQLKMLEILDLSSNPINDINLNTFSVLTNLRILRLKNSGLKKLDYGQFSQQSNLIELDISYNRLSDLSLNHLVLLMKLKELYLEGNNLRELDVVDLDHFSTQLEHFGIADNRFNCTFLMKVAKMFKQSLVVNADVAQFNIRNIRGMACYNESFIDPILDKKLPVRQAPKHTEAFEEIENKLAILSDTIVGLSGNDALQYRESYAANISELQRKFIELQIDLDLRLNEQKSSVVLSIADLLNLNDNQINGSDTFRRAFEKVNNINLERFQLLARRIEHIENGLQLNSPGQYGNYNNGSNGWFIVGVLFAVFNLAAIVFVVYYFGYSNRSRVPLRMASSMATDMTAC